MRAKLREVAEAALHDPKQALWDSLGDAAEGIEMHRAQVLVATYIAPPRIMKGPNGEDVLFHKTDRGYQEDRYQGKCFLVLRVGPLAFKDDRINQFGGLKADVGDWVIATPSEGRELFLVDASGAGTCCRIFEDVNIKGRVSDPALIY